MPDAGVVDSVEDEVGEGDRVDSVVFFASVEGAIFEGVDVFGGGDVGVVLSCHVFIGLGKKAACSASGIIDSLANFGGDRFDHGADDDAGSEELSAVVAFFAHF